MKLKKAQKEAVLQWIAEGLESDEINKRAAKFKPRFKVLRSQVDYYRKSRGIKLGEIRTEGETDALKAGFAVKVNRVIALQRLADKMLEELTREDDNRMWVKMVKGIGSHKSYERIEYEEFNKAEVDAFRGVLEDISAEVGERIRRTDLTSGNKPLRSGFDLKQLKKYSNDELAILEHAAALLERADADQEPSPTG